MIVLHPAKSYVLMEEVFDRQNVSKPLGARLKGAHLELMKALVRLLKKECGHYQQAGHKASRDGVTLRSLRTNTVQLAKMLRRSERTVRNLLNRLGEFCWLKKTFHGSNASFEIEVNTDLLFLQETTETHSDNVVQMFANPLPPIRQNLPHTLSPSVTRQVTNEENELSGVVPDAAPAAAPADATPAPTQQQPDTGTGYHPSSENPASISKVPAPSKKVARKKVPPPTLPGSMDALARHLDRDARAQLERLVDTVFEHAEEELHQFWPSFVVPAERERGRIALAEYFIYSNPAAWKAAAQQFVDRVDLAGRWLERRHDAGKKAFVPIPSIWFDLRNPHGFAVTKDWWKTRQHQIRQMKIKVTIDRAWKDYERSLQANTATTPEEALRRIRQYLEKRGGPALYALFQQRLTLATSLNAVAS